MVKPGNAIQRVEPFTSRPRPGMNTITSTTSATGSMAKRSFSSRVSGTQQYTNTPRPTLASR
jgi:hypothetical protein